MDSRFLVGQEIVAESSEIPENPNELVFAARTKQIHEVTATQPHPPCGSGYRAFAPGALAVNESDIRQAS